MQAADRRDEGRQLVVALLEHDVDVRPRLVDALAQGDDRVVGRRPARNTTMATSRPIGERRAAIQARASSGRSRRRARRRGPSPSRWRATAPSRPTRNRSCWRSTAAPGRAVGDEQRDVGRAGEDERLGGDVEAALGRARRRRPRPSAARVGLRVELRRPRPAGRCRSRGWRRCPRPSPGRRRAARPRAPRRGRAATSGSSSASAAADRRCPPRPGRRGRRTAAPGRRS